MKIKIIPAIIALGISLLMAYGFYSFCDTDRNFAMAAGSFATAAITLLVTIAGKFELPRTSANVKTVAGLFCVLSIASNLVFAYITFAMPAYVITMGIEMLVFLLITYSIYQAKQ